MDELSNHMGNVLAVISDRGELQSTQDYYPFGMAMPGRSSGSYRYGFNGKETDPETGIQDYGMRWYLPNIARFPSVDPLTPKYPSWSPYPFAMNSPIAGVDLDGLEFYYAADGSYLGQGKDEKNQEVRLAKLGKPTEDGSKTFEAVDMNGKSASQWTVIHPDHEIFKRFAAMVYAESIGDRKTEDGIFAYDPKEVKAIASATLSLVKASKEVGLNYELEDIVTKKGSSSAIGNADFEKYRSVGWEKNWRGANEGAINALLGGIDYSNGAIHWDGADLARQGTAHSHFAEGKNCFYLGIDATHYNAFIKSIKAYWNWDDEKAKQKLSIIKDEELMHKTVAMESSAAYGMTIFWKYKEGSTAQTKKQMVYNAGQSAARQERLKKAKKP